MPSENDFTPSKSAKKLALNLQNDDRRGRKQTFVDLQAFLTANDYTNQELRVIFTEIQMYTLNGLRDKTESVREQAVKFHSFFIIDKLPINDFYLTYIFPVLVERIGSCELIEESEEIRLVLVQFLHNIVQKYAKTEQLKPFLGDCVTILQETVKDKFHSIKELSCSVVMDLAEALPLDIHKQAESLIKPVLTCFTHQRFRVRVQAIKTIGVLIMHSSYNGLNEALGPMAEKLFDQIAVVRRTVAQVAYKWLIDYRDRYSFFAKILPLILTGLNDEVEETRIEAHQLWEKVGLQYQQENEKDLKDQLDFVIELPKYYPEHLKRPNLGCRVLVQRNISKLAPALAIELNSWQADIRVRCSQLLCALALHAEDNLTQNLQDLLQAMYTAARDTDPRVSANIEQAAKLMGLFIPPKTWFLLLSPLIKDGTVHWGHLSILANFIDGAPSEYITKHLNQITILLADNDICLSRNKHFQCKLWQCCQIIVKKLNSDNCNTGGKSNTDDCNTDLKTITDNCNTDMVYHLFKIICVLNALKCDDLLINFDLLKEIGNPVDLWISNLKHLLKDIGNSPESWTVVTMERCVFQTILMESKEAFGRNLQEISGILVKSLNPSCDPESCLKTFWALSEAFNAKEVIFKNAENLSGFLKILITDVFVPNLVWHAGRTAEAMRTMTLSCLKCALQPSLTLHLFDNADELRELFDELLPLLLSLMEDASFRSRIFSVECLGLLKVHLVGCKIWNENDLIKIYPEILKRFDDPTEQVRLCAISALPDLFEACPVEFQNAYFNAHHELIVDTLLVHLDDTETEHLIYEILKKFASINRNILMKKIQVNSGLLRNQTGCEELLQYLNKLEIS